MARQRRTLLATFGDVDPTSYGGGIIYAIDTNAGRKVEMEYTRGQEEQGGPRLQLYRVDVPDDVRSWFRWVKWDAVAITMDVPESEIAASASSKDPVKRALVCELIAGYYGWDELDGYPIELSAAEIRRRWRFGRKVR